MSDLKTRVEELLRSLGTTADEVADSLRARRMYGLRDEGCDCPVANLLKAEIAEARTGTWGNWGNEQTWLVTRDFIHTPEGDLPTPGPVSGFISLFDNGRNGVSFERPYSDLEER